MSNGSSFTHVYGVGDVKAARAALREHMKAHRKWDSPERTERVKAVQRAQGLSVPQAHLLAKIALWPDSAGYPMKLEHHSAKATLRRLEYLGYATQWVSNSLGSVAQLTEMGQGEARRLIADHHHLAYPLEPRHYSLMRDLDGRRWVTFKRSGEGSVWTAALVLQSYGLAKVLPLGDTAPNFEVTLTRVGRAELAYLNRKKT